MFQDSYESPCILSVTWHVAVYFSILPLSSQLNIHVQCLQGTTCLTCHLTLDDARAAAHSWQSAGHVSAAAATSFASESGPCLLQAEALDPACLAMFARLMHQTQHPQTMEYLMAGMWILLRNPDNRTILSTAFDHIPLPGKR